MHSNSLPGFHNIDSASDSDDGMAPGNYDTENESIHHDQEQTQENDEEDDDQGYEEGDGEGEDEEEEEEGDDDDDLPEWLYLVDLLRQPKINWLQCPQYSTHKLVVVQDNTTNPIEDADIGAEEEMALETPPQVFNVMHHFLVPASAIFRDFHLNSGQEPADGDGQIDQDEDDEAKTHRLHQEERLSCLQTLPQIQVSSSADTSNVEPLLLPSLGSDMPPWVVDLLESVASTEPESKPTIQLKLPAPQHFPALLKVVYDGDLKQWQQATFTPTSIAPILHNVLRLQCSSSFVICCLEYYRSIQDQIDPATMETSMNNESWQQLWDMFDRAVLTGLLPPEPEVSLTIASDHQNS